MSRQERKVRERADREARIVDCAADIAEREGWSAVTTRRLADEIDYSPPVLYGHFPDGRAGIVNAVAVRGFGRLADQLATASPDSGPGRLRVTIERYLDFAAQSSATYAAMFSMEISAEFAHDSTPPELQRAFAAIADVVGDGPARGPRAEVLWSALHGLATLTRDGRLPTEAREDRIDALVAMVR